MLKSAVPSVGPRLSHLRRTSVCLPHSCCWSWGGFSPVPPSSTRLLVPWEATDWHPDCQADDGSYHENQIWQGEVRPQEWPPLNLRKRGRCSQLPQLCVRACMCACLRVWMLVLNADIWGRLFWYMCPLFPGVFMISIWTRSLSLVVGCKILFWKLTKYQHPLTPVCQGRSLTFPNKPKRKN